MELIKDINKIKKPYKNAVITIGNFDGVHKGHQKLLKRVRQTADAIGGTAIAMTFEPHPLKVLTQNSQIKQITPFEQKIELLSDANPDVILCVPFTKEFAAMSAQDFVYDLLVKKIGMKAIVVGKDYTFGRKREGNIVFLKQCAGNADFKVIVEDWKNMDGKSARISSTRIRDFITNGRVDDVEKILGRNYQVRGHVVPGRDRGGKLLGFPTANINLVDELNPKTGVYAVTVDFKGKLYKGVANIGYSPTFDDNMYTVEVHILDFNKDIYGEKIKINFISRLRDEEKFSNVPELAEQIEKDVQKARKIFNGNI
jgi:riboflavin kinase/FMN adenylyltransferase